jgi:hypothetical protein
MSAVGSAALAEAVPVTQSDIHCAADSAPSERTPAAAVRAVAAPSSASASRGSVKLSAVRPPASEPPARRLTAEDIRGDEGASVLQNWRQANKDDNLRAYEVACEGVDALLSLQLEHPDEAVRSAARTSSERDLAVLAQLLSAAAHSAERQARGRSRGADWAARAEEKAARALNLVPLQPHALLVAGRLCRQKQRLLYARWFLERCSCAEPAAVPCATLDAEECKQHADDELKRIRKDLHVALKPLKAPLGKDLVNFDLPLPDDTQLICDSVKQVLGACALDAILYIQKRDDPCFFRPGPDGQPTETKVTVGELAEVSTGVKAGEHARMLRRVLSMTPLSTMPLLTTEPSKVTDATDIVVVSWNIKAMSPLALGSGLPGSLPEKVVSIAKVARAEGACLLVLQECPGTQFGADWNVRMRETRMNTYIEEMLPGWAYAQADTGSADHAEAHGFVYHNDVLKLLQPPMAHSAKCFVRPPVLALFIAAPGSMPDAPARALGILAVLNVHLKAGKTGSMNAEAREELRRLPEVVTWADEIVRNMTATVAGCDGGNVPLPCTFLIAGDFNLCCNPGAAAASDAKETMCERQDWEPLLDAMRFGLLFDGAHATNLGPPVTASSRCYDTILMRYTPSSPPPATEMMQKLLRVNEGAARAHVYDLLETELSCAKEMLDCMNTQLLRLPGAPPVPAAPRGATPQDVADDEAAEQYVASDSMPLFDHGYAAALRELIKDFKERHTTFVTRTWSDHKPLVARLPVRLQSADSEALVQSVGVDGDGDACNDAADAVASPVRNLTGQIEAALDPPAVAAVASAPE